MPFTFSLALWSLLAPLLGVAVLVAKYTGFAEMLPLPALAVVLCGVTIGSVLAAVHHAEVVAHRVGEPYGTLVLALAVTIIEVALIVTLMIAAGEDGATLARDTVFAAIMLILNGVVGLCILIGAARHGEQVYVQLGVSAALAVLSALAVLTLILPNYTTSTPGPYYTPTQLAFVAFVSLLLYGMFVFIQTVRHRDYFLPDEGAISDETVHAPPPTNAVAWASMGLLMLSLGVVILLAKAIAPLAEAVVDALEAPKATVGILVAGLVLLPESVAAVRAALADRLQTSLNLALGSALATIGLTIPAVAVLSLTTGWTLTLGLDAKGVTLLGLTLLVSTLSLGTGRTTVLQGMVHLVILAAFILTTVVP